MLQGNLTKWGRVTHICVSKLSILGSDNCLSPGRRQANIWTNAGILSIWPLGTNFSEIFIEINTFFFKKMHLKMSSGKWRPFCLGLNVLIKQNCALRTPHAWKNTEKLTTGREKYMSCFSYRYIWKTSYLPRMWESLRDSKYTRYYSLCLS